MHKITPWMFLVIALMWLLPLVSVNTGIWGSWIATIAMVVAGVLNIKSP